MDRNARHPRLENWEAGPALPCDRCACRPHLVQLGEMDNHIDGGLTGPILIMLTTDYYSHDHQQLLMPQGTRLIGTVQSVGNAQQRKMFVTFHRAICPDGFSLELDKYVGLDTSRRSGASASESARSYYPNLPSRQPSSQRPASVHFRSEPGSLAQPAKGIPCLQQVAFNAADGHLEVTGFYALQHHVPKAYGRVELQQGCRSAQYDPADFERADQAA